MYWDSIAIMSNIIHIPGKLFFREQHSHHVHTIWIHLYFYATLDYILLFNEFPRFDANAFSFVSWKFIVSTVHARQSLGENIFMMIIFQYYSKEAFSAS